MRRDRLEVREGKVALVIGDVQVEEVEPRELVRLYDVELPSDDPNLARFYLADFTRTRWVVPYLTTGCVAGIAALCAGKGASAQLYRAELDALPWRWRWRLLGIPFASVPRLMRCELGPAPEWTTLDGPLDALGPDCSG